MRTLLLQRRPQRPRHSKHFAAIPHGRTRTVYSCVYRALPALKACALKASRARPQRATARSIRKGLLPIVSFRCRCYLLAGAIRPPASLTIGWEVQSPALAACARAWRPADVLIRIATFLRFRQERLPEHKVWWRRLLKTLRFSEYCSVVPSRTSLRARASKAAQQWLGVAWFTTTKSAGYVLTVHTYSAKDESTFEGYTAQLRSSTVILRASSATRGSSRLFYCSPTSRPHTSHSAADVRDRSSAPCQHCACAYMGNAERALLDEALADFPRQAQAQRVGSSSTELVMAC